MYFKIFAIVAALAVAVSANPAPAEALDCVTVEFPATCPGDHPINCNGAGGITLCCTSCT
ncbi:hypothetical protein PENSPDRAFT_646784 [Peniophora sp. CONT]|nr:hypothetical protein PENSPDRAFT_646784 [Peniophora sp. CONT]